MALLKHLEQGVWCKRLRPGARQGKCGKIGIGGKTATQGYLWTHPHIPAICSTLCLTSMVLFLIKLPKPSLIFQIQGADTGTEIPAPVQYRHGIVLPRKFLLFRSHHQFLSEPPCSRPPCSGMHHERFHPFDPPGKCNPDGARRISLERLPESRKHHDSDIHRNCRNTHLLPNQIEG